MAATPPGGPDLWTPEFRELVDSVGASDDLEYVLDRLHDERAPLRLKIAEWFSPGDVHWLRHSIDPEVVGPLRGHPEMPDDIAATLTHDVDPTVASIAVMRARDVGLLVELALSPDTHP